MARTVITVQDVPYQGSVNPVTFTAADQANGMEFANDGRTVLVVKNDDVAAKQVTIDSVPSSVGRTGDIVESVAAGEISYHGPFIKAIWNQSGGVMHVDFDADTNLEVAALRTTVAP